jgi:hypothetical protein
MGHCKDHDIMTTCTYCKCEVSERDAAPDDVARHRDLFVCSFALMRVNAALLRRVAELENKNSALEHAIADANAAIAYLNDRVQIDREGPVVQTSEDRKDYHEQSRKN